MDKDSKFTRDEDGYVAVRTVSAPYSSGSDDKDSMFTRDEDGYVAVRVTGSGGGGDSHNLGWYATSSDLTTAYPTAEAGDWAIVGATDTVWVWDTDNTEWVDSDQKGQVTSVNNQTGAVTITADDILPSQTGNSGKFLTTNGTSSSWGYALSVPNNNYYIDPRQPSMLIGQYTGTLFGSASGFSGNTPINGFTISRSNTNGNEGVKFDMIGSTGMVVATYKMEATNGFYCDNATIAFPNAKNLGTSGYKWKCTFTEKINNGQDITVPAVGGTLALQIATLPTAGSTYEGTIYQYIGVTDSTYTNGRFYKCVSDGGNPATYSWERIDVQPQGVTINDSSTTSLTETWSASKLNTMIGDVETLLSQI